jgi:hypothetical protein
VRGSNFEIDPSRLTDTPTSSDSLVVGDDSEGRNKRFEL